MTNPKPQLTYRVSCLATLLHRLEFEVEASSSEEAIQFCHERTDSNGKFIEPVDDEFIETESEDAWSAHPIG